MYRNNFSSKTNLTENDFIIYENYGENVNFKPNDNAYQMRWKFLDFSLKIFKQKKKDCDSVSSAMTMMLYS